jgi:hypothetical protein
MLLLVIYESRVLYKCSILPLPVGTGRPRPPLRKKSIDFDHEILENEKNDFDHEIINFVEKNVGTPAILSKTLQMHYRFLVKAFTTIYSYRPLSAFLFE